MTRPVLDTDARHGPFPGCIEPAFVTRYSAATRDPSPRAQSGSAVPAVAIATQIWVAQHAARQATTNPDLPASASGGVHGAHDIVLHRPIVLGEPLVTWVRGLGARPAGRNVAVTLHYLTLDSRGGRVAEQWWTTIYLDTTCLPVGAAPPEHRFPDDARQRPAGTFTAFIDADMPRRYAEVSADWSPHHFDAAAAQATGAERPFLHGLATMALCAQGVVDTVAGRDPDRIRRIAARFAAPTYPDEDLRVRMYDAGPDTIAFEADNAGRLVISQGRVEVRP